MVTPHVWSNDGSPEFTLLARMVWNPEDARYCADNVDPSVFSSRASRQLFLTIAQESAKGFTPTTLSAKLATGRPEVRNLFDDLIGTDGLDDSFEGTPINQLVPAVTEWAKAEKFRKAVAIAHESLGSGDTPDEVREKLDKHLASIDTASLTDRSYDDKHIMAAQVRDFLYSPEARGLTFGFERWDSRVMPMLEGNFVLVGGASGAGKSTVMRNVVRSLVHRGKKTALFSFEMLGLEQLPNLACMDTGLDIGRYIKQQFSPYEQKQFDDALSWWENNEDFILNERAAVTPESIFRAMKRYRALGVKVFVLDHLHRVIYGEGKDDIRLPMAAFARGIKNFAADENCIVIAGVQYVKIKPTVEPDDSSIREANNILEEGNYVFHVWQPLVAGEQTTTGEFVPRSNADGSRILADYAEKGAVLGNDPERIYIKCGKQRIRPWRGMIVMPFNPASGLMYDTNLRNEEYAA
jgi:replicative DNA helicase